MRCLEVRIKIGMVLATCLYLSGCGASGVQIKPEQLSDFKKGVTTESEVISKLGSPTSRSINADGSHLLMYNYLAYQARPETLIPVVGPLVGGADVQSSMVWFQFSPDGKLANYSANESATGSALNFAAPSTPRTPNQPVAVQQ